MSLTEYPPLVDFELKIGGLCSSYEHSILQNKLDLEKITERVTRLRSLLTKFSSLPDSDDVKGVYYNQIWTLTREMIEARDREQEKYVDDTTKSALRTARIRQLQAKQLTNSVNKLLEDNPRLAAAAARPEGQPAAS